MLYRFSVIFQALHNHVKNRLFLFLDPLQCFFPETNAAVRNSFSITGPNSQNQPVCAKKCHEGGILDGSCAGVMHNGVNCKFLKLVSVNPPSSQNERDTLYLDSKYYMRSINLRWVPTQHSSIKVMFFS